MNSLVSNKEKKEEFVKKRLKQTEGRNQQTHKVLSAGRAKASWISANLGDIHPCHSVMPQHCQETVAKQPGWKKNNTFMMSY